MAQDPETCPACPRCPKCASTNTRYTVKAAYGRYCYCGECGNAWYHEDTPAPPVFPDDKHPPR